MKYWLSSRAMTVCVQVDDKDIVIAAAPIVKRFVGQPLAALCRWMRSHGGFRIESLYPE